MLQHLASLQVERPLILQPSPIVRHAANLLAVVVRHRVLHRGARRIYTELFDAVEELLLLLPKAKN